MVDFLSKKTLAGTLELTIDSAVKILDKSDILNDTGLPLGKATKYLVDKIISISDTNESFRKAFLKAFHISLHSALSNYVNELKVDADELKKIRQLQQVDFDVTEFDIGNIENNKIYREAVSIYKSILCSVSRLSQKEIDSIFFSIPILLKIRIVEILESNPVVYKKFKSFLDSRKYNLYLEKRILDDYRLRISQNIFSDCFFNSDTTKYDYYVETGFSIYGGFLDEAADNKMYKIMRSIIERSIEEGKTTPINFPYYDVHYSTDNLLEDFVSGNPLKNFRIHGVKLILLLGHPGQGKTTLCEHLIFNTIYSNHLSSEFLFIKLRNIRKVARLIEEPLSILSEYLIKVERLKTELIDFNKSILILDGLDELKMREGLSSAFIEEFIKELILQTEMYPGLRIILTSRHGYADLNKLQTESNLLVIGINLFNLEKQKKWLRKYLKRNNRSKTVNDKILEEWHGEPNINRHILELIEIPFLLSLITTLPNSLPRGLSRTGLYNHVFTELLTRRYNNNRINENLQGLTPDTLRSIIQQIAYAIQIENGNYISKTKLIEKANRLKNLKNVSISGLKDSLKGFLITFYFREQHDPESDEYVIEFMHKSLQDYMVAEHIIKEILKMTEKVNGINEKEFLLEYLNEIYVDGGISHEIQAYIQQLIYELPNHRSHLLRATLVDSLEYFVSKDFLSERFRSKGEIVNAIKQTFFGLKPLLSKLGIYETQMPPKLRKRFIRYLHLRNFGL